MKQIIVASDLSNRSERALRRAFSIAEAKNAKLTVLSIIDSELPDKIAKAMASEAEQELKQLCESISTYPSMLVVETGDPKVLIHENADEIDADLIILGMHRHQLLTDMFAGTTMERLVRASTRPVLIVRDPVDHPYRRAVCGLDMSPSCVAAAQACAELAPDATIATFHAVHIPFRGFLAPHGSAEEVMPFVEDAKKRLESWMATADLPSQCEPPSILPESVGAALYRTVKTVDADLICIGAHGRPSLSPSYLGTIAEELLRNPPTDLIIVRR